MIASAAVGSRSAHREVDRVREESRAAAQLKTAGKQHDQLRQRLDTALAQLSTAQQVAAAESARASTLAQQLTPSGTYSARQCQVSQAGETPATTGSFEFVTGTLFTVRWRACGQRSAAGGPTTRLASPPRLGLLVVCRVSFYQ